MAGYDDNSSGSHGNSQLHTSPPQSDSRVELIIQRLKLVTGAENDSQLAEFLEINKQGIYQARKRGAIPPAWLVLASEKATASMDWVYYGTGTQFHYDLSGEEIDAGEVAVAVNMMLNFREGLVRVKSLNPQSVLNFFILLNSYIPSVFEMKSEKPSGSYLLFDLPKSNTVFFVEYHFLFDSKNDYDHIRMIRRISGFLGKKYMTANFEIDEMQQLKFWSNYNMGGECSCTKYIREMFKWDDLEVPLDGVEMIEQAEKDSFRKNIEYVVGILKDSGATSEVIQQAVLKLIERQ